MSSFKKACELNFGGELGEKILYVMQTSSRYMRVRYPLYTTPFRIPEEQDD